MINLKGFRKDKNIKQKVICELLNIAQPYLSAIERGERPLSKEKFSVLHKHYGDVIFNYKNADIVIEHRKNGDFDPSDKGERSRFLSVIENLQKTIEYQQFMLNGLQKALDSKQESVKTVTSRELSELNTQLETGLSIAAAASEAAGASIANSEVTGITTAKSDMEIDDSSSIVVV